MQVRLWRINLLLELDDPGRAEAEIEAYGETARQLGQPRTLVYDPLHRALMANMRGDFAAGERLTAAANRRAGELQGSIAQLVAMSQRFFEQRLRGRHAESEASLRQNADSLPLMRRWRCLLAVLLAENGRFEEARRELDQLAAADFADFPRGAPWMLEMALLAELCTLLGDRPRARLIYDMLAPFEGRNVLSLGAAYLGPVARYLGLLAMTIGEDERALGHLETARSATQRIGARPMAVLSALDAAEVLARRGLVGDAERGTALVESVAREAEELGMDGAVARVADLRARLATNLPAAPAPEAPRRVARLVRASDVWQLDFDGRSFHLRDAKGLRQLAALLARPGAAIPALTLALPGPAPATDLRAQRARAGELRDEIAEARAFNDPERAARAGALLEDLARELEGDDRTLSAERARVNVTRAIRAALRRIAAHEPELGRLLERTIRTGTSCVYHPDPDVPLDWEVGD